MNENKTIDYYNQNANSFSKMTQSVDFSTTQDKFLALLQPNAFILDFGCGSGRDTKYFMDHGYRVEATDGSEELCRLASTYAGVPVKHMLFQELDEQKSTLGDRYPNKLYNRLRKLMEDGLNDQADWLQFESYFNSAHHNFMERLRQRYADITTGDLRLCCLLRMNLSTKEIASLLNVSVRAIEIRRYRLRKRLMLESDTNLVDFLLKFGEE